jgi:general L-amino acid transport system substrate-binding protein
MMLMKGLLRGLILLLMAFGLSLDAEAQPRGSTLQAVKTRGILHCGADGEQMGFSIPMSGGAWIGFDVDYCRAIAAAIFDDPSKVKFFPLSTVERFKALQSGEIDVLARNTTWTSSRDTAMGLNFAGINYYDGQGFMVRREARIGSVLDLSGATVCVEKGTTSELNLADYFRANRMQLKALAASSNAEMLKAYEEGKCVAMTTDVSALYSERLRLLAAERHVILPDVISKEPLGPVVRHGDDQWLDIVKWTHFALLTAEELGVDRRNAEAMLKSSNPEIQRLLGVDGKHGEALGLTNDWAYRMIRKVGNYGEIFEKNLGRGSPLGMNRRLNALWTGGGLHFAPPIR